MMELEYGDLAPATWRKIELFRKLMLAERRVERLKRELYDVTIPAEDMPNYLRVTDEIIATYEEHDAR